MKKLLKISNGEYIKMTFDECYEQFKHMISSQCKKYLPTFKNEYEDLYQCGFKGLYKAYVDYDISKNTCFSTIAYEYIHTEIYLYSRSNKEYLKLLSLNNMLEDSDGKLREYESRLIHNVRFEENVIDKIAAQEDMKIINSIIEELKPLHKEILTKYFLEGIRQKDLAEYYGLTSNYVSTIIKNSLKNLKKYYDLKKQINSFNMEHSAGINSTLKPMSNSDIKTKLSKNTWRDNPEIILSVAKYILANKCTTREAAKHFNSSTCTISRYMSKYLKEIDELLYTKVQEVLKQNKLKCPWTKKDNENMTR